MWFIISLLSEEQRWGSVWCAWLLGAACHPECHPCELNLTEIFLYILYCLLCTSAFLACHLHRIHISYLILPIMIDALHYALARAWTLFLLFPSYTHYICACAHLHRYKSVWAAVMSLSCHVFLMPLSRGSLKSFIINTVACSTPSWTRSVLACLIWISPILLFFPLQTGILTFIYINLKGCYRPVRSSRGQWGEVGVHPVSG